MSRDFMFRILVTPTVRGFGPSRELAGIVSRQSPEGLGCETWACPEPYWLGGRQEEMGKSPVRLGDFSL